MTNTANIRFEPSNVAYVAVDLDTHEMSGGVMDETTGTFYPVGGGGGDGTIRCCKINIINNDPDYDLYLDYEDQYALDQGYLSQDNSTPFVYVPGLNAYVRMSNFNGYKIADKNGGTGVIYIPQNAWVEGGETVYGQIMEIKSAFISYVTPSAVDNVSITEDGGKKIITLTDVTKDGELTLALTHSE